MMPAKDMPDPFCIVATALGRSRESLSPDSAMYRDHGWDSFGHVSVIKALEDAYGIRINDEDIEKYVSMKAILQLYEQLKQRGE